MADQKVLALQNGRVEEVVVQTGSVTELRVDNGNATTTFQNFVLRLDFGQGGATINPSGTP